MIPKPRSVPFVIAADVGGTHSRIGCFDLAGSLLAHSTGRGGSPEHNRDGADNVRAAVSRALSSGGLDAKDAVALAAGVAAVKHPDLRRTGDPPPGWADELFAHADLTCPRAIVNDAVAAHRGALLGEPGVLVVAGTGSMILAVTDQGGRVENGHFGHYAGGAPTLAWHAIQLLLAGRATTKDAALVVAILGHWGAADVGALRSVVTRRATDDDFAVHRHVGAMAPLITSHADSPLASSSLRWLAEITALGVALVAPSVGRTEVLVSTVGALATNTAFESQLRKALGEFASTPARLVAPRLDPLAGAALLALDQAGVEASTVLIARLSTAR